MNPRQPDTITVAVTRVDGGVTILQVVEKEYEPDGHGGRRLRKEYAVDTAYVDSLIARYVNDGHWGGGKAPVSWRFVPSDFATEDRGFRDAWKDDRGLKVGVDMPKAREIHKERLRVKRLPLMDALDVAYSRADEQGDQSKKREIAAKKQALRDVTADPAIEAAQTPEELKNVIPEALRG